MSDVGDGVVNNVTNTFSDSAASVMSSNTLTSGTYRPTDVTDGSPLGDMFPSPAPAPPYGTNLAIFNGTNPNGTWSLYIHDDGPGDTGTITNGWSLDITTYPVANTPPTLSGIGPQTTTVNKATAAIPFTVFDAETAPSSLALTAFTSNGGLVPTNNIVFGGSGSNRTVTLTPVSNQLGTVTISLNVSDGALVASNSFVLTMNPATLVVTANSTNRVYGAGNPIIGGSVVGLQAGDNITGTFTNTAANSGSPVGIYTNTVTLSDPNGKLGNYIVTTNRGTLTVTAAPLTVTASDTNKVYGTTRVFGGTEFAITSGALVNGNTLTSVTLTSSGANGTAVAGTYPITPSAAVGSGLVNYSITYSNGTMTVVPAALTVTANSTNKAYGTNRIFAGTEFAITSGALVNGNTLTSVTLTSAGTNASAPAGTYPITASAAVGTGLVNYSITYSNGTLTVTPAALTVSANNTNKVYGATRVFAGTEFAITGGALVNGNTLTSVTLASAGTNAAATVGSYPITITNATGTGLTNYTIAYNSGTLTVGTASLQITAGDTNKVYGVTLNPTAFGVTGLLNGDNVSGVSLNSAGSVGAAPVGGYVITASGATGSGLTNYTIGYSNGTLTVGAAPLAIAALNTNKAYGVTLTFVGNEFLATGLANADSVSSVLFKSDGASAAAAPGEYPISVTNALGTGLTNYSITYVDGLLNITGPLPPFAINAVVVSDGVAAITWSSVSNVAYRLQYTDDVTGTNWTEVLPEIVALGNSSTATNVVGDVIQRFYRVRRP